MKPKTTTTFLVSWCSEGLETVVNVTDLQQQETFAILSNKPVTVSVNRIYSMLLLRARFNTQRFYEIYSVEATDGITEDDIREMFENSPQTAADTIRERGAELYSDRQKPSRIKIT